MNLYRQQPAAHMSISVLYVVFPRHSSGALYHREATFAVVCPWIAYVRASPKSVIFNNN